jgi:hypothetical protein
VNHSSAANSQFGPRQRESNCDYNEENFQNEENLQYEQKEAHDRSPVVAVDESDQWVKLAAERSEKTNAPRSRTIMIGAASDLFPVPFPG